MSAPARQSPIFARTYDLLQWLLPTPAAGRGATASP